MDAKVATTKTLREERGRALFAAKGDRIRHLGGETYFVPSQANDSGYIVNAAAGTCMCPDFEDPSEPCKHVWALRISRSGQAPPASVIAVHRVTYRQDWPSYNRAQSEEKERFELLLRGLCDGISQPPPQKTGRPRLPLRDVVYSAAIKVYLTCSGRRATTDIRRCAAQGLIERAPSYNSIFRSVEQPSLQPLLAMMVAESATPLCAIEHTFAVDGTGFATSTYGRWFDERYGGQRKKQLFVKAHAMIGTQTGIVTAVKATDGSEHDSPHLTELLATTKASGFDVREVTADKAYLSNDNLAAIEAVGAVPYIPFKSNSSPTGATEAWQRLYHYFSLNKQDFLVHYHQRSNVEAVFSAIKRMFGSAVRSKLQAAQFNEVLLKCLCHNLAVLVHAIHELQIAPKFWMPSVPEAT